ncbi:MAG: c-type cytochrome [Gammaproteobacteria bacterium]|nr:c-type cytochrome [Gammaproteobacteria bacterium]
MKTTIQTTMQTAMQKLFLTIILAAISVSAFANKLDVNKAIKLSVDIDKGKQLYQINCSRCHQSQSYISKQHRAGTIPLIAGQHKNVLIKQLIDIRNGDRQNLIMYPYTLNQYLKNESEIADVSAYIAQLPVSVNNTQGDGKESNFGKKLYNDNCKSCHGVKAEGNNNNFVPKLQGQEYNYLLRQFVMIRDKRRAKTHPKMLEAFNKISQTDKFSVLDYISRINP